MRTKIKELREKSPDELAADRQTLREEALNLRIQQESGQLENPARIREVRREVARINTLLSERKRLAAATAEDATEATATAAAAGEAESEPEAEAAPKKKAAAKKKATTKKKAAAKKKAAKKKAADEGDE